MELQMQCYITPFFAYERFFFVYNDISSRYYNLLSIRLGDCVYKHYTLWHIKCQWVAIGKKAATTGCFLQHYFNSIPLWQVYKQVRKKKTVQKLIVTDSDDKTINKGSCLKPKHQQADIISCLANALGSASCSSPWSFFHSLALSTQDFYTAPAVDDLDQLCFRPAYAFSATPGAVPVFPLACLWVVLLGCSSGAHGLPPLTSDSILVLHSHSSFSP